MSEIFLLNSNKKISIKKILKLTGEFDSFKFQDIPDYDIYFDEKDENSIRTFVVVLSLIAQASAIKKLVQKIVNGYHS